MRELDLPVQSRYLDRGPKGTHADPVLGREAQVVGGKGGQALHYVLLLPRSCSNKISKPLSLSIEFKPHLATQKWTRLLGHTVC